MATSKEYAYYIKGNKVAIIEKDWALSGGQTLSQPGLNDLGSTDGSLWKSPKASITDGLEIQYTYSPTYTFPDVQIQSDANADITKFYMNGWTSVDGYLTLLNSGRNWSSYTKVDVNDNIYIGGSERWHGIHKIQEIQGADDVTHGGIKTYTKVSDNIPFVTDSSVSWTSAETILLLTALSMESAFTDSTTTPYIWISGSDENVTNNGMFSGWTVDADGTTLRLSSATRYTIGPGSASLVTETEATPDFDTDSPENIYIYKAYHDPSMYFITDVTIMEDESFELDIPRYQANAVVQYVKSKYLEDAGNVEMKEYYMREFRRMVEKHESGKKRGVYVTQGFGLFR